MKKHKHNYIMILTGGTEEKQTIKADDGLLEIFSTRGACMVICSECGKHKKHLENKIGKLYTNTLVHDFVQGYKDDMADAEIKKYRVGRKL